MSTSVMSTSLQERVQNELVWDPEVMSNNIGVTSKEGAVSLTGFVGSFAEKMAAERAAFRVSGTRAVANDLTVKYPGEHLDIDVAKRAADALRYNLSVPQTIKAAVRDGHVTLEGMCEWCFQRNAAEQAVTHLLGVRSVTNAVAIKPRVSPGLVKDRIEEAIERNAALDAKNITVMAVGATVTLSGRVRFYAERAEAERAAWAAPGVVHVQNNITIA